MVQTKQEAPYGLLFCFFRAMGGQYHARCFLGGVIGKKKRLPVG